MKRSWLGLTAVFLLLSVLGAPALAAENPIPASPGVTIVDRVVAGSRLQKFTPQDLKDLVAKGVVREVVAERVIVYGENEGDRGVWTFRGVRLADLVKYATGYEEKKGNPLYGKRKGLYLACYATDGYSGVVSWPELQLSPTGAQAMVAYDWQMVKAPNAGDNPSWQGKLMLVVPTDSFTGARLIQALKTIEVRHVGEPTPLAAREPQGQIMLASTIGPVDAGIVSALEEVFERETGIRVRHVGAGTGAALELAKSGQFDVLLVHARALEEKFVADGYGTKRYDLMYNDFVIMGPPEDPAGIKGETSAVAALRKLAAAQALFISRGDQSGTHVKELEVWQAAGIKPQGSWYRIYEKGAAGNGPTLLYTDEQNAYTLMDRATYLTLKKQLHLAVLVEGDPVLLNYITVIPVSPQKFPKVKHDEALQFVNWLTSRQAQLIIRDFRKDEFGESLFFPNSAEGKNL